MVVLGLLERVRAVLESYIGKVYSGANLAVVDPEGNIHSIYVGYSQLKPYKDPLRPNSIFDVASLTKCLSTAVIAMKLVEDGLIHLKDKVADLLPEFRYTVAGGSEVKEKVRVWMLLSHTSGLPPWIPLYRVKDRSQILNEAVRAYPSYDPGSDVVYSDVGYIVLTALIERVTGERLDALFDKIVGGPLKLKRTVYNPLGRGFSRNEIVATEYDEATGESLRGLPHDQNARAMEGVSGHAGLFSTASESALIVRSLINAYRGSWSEILSPPSARAMFRIWGCGRYGGLCYGIGWQVYDPLNVVSGGDLLTPKRAFGHTGFTGTSIWIDLDLDIAIVLYTNRVHVDREGVHIHRVRSIVHNHIVSKVGDLNREGGQ